jgi:hypothetical protein
MSYERRLHSRNDVRWRGHATLSDGPQLPVRVLDVSAGGARLAIAAHRRPRRQELLELTVSRVKLWPFSLGRLVTALGRVVRVSPGDEDGTLQVAMRFHTPLPERSLRFHLPWLSGQDSVQPNATACA